MNTQQLKPYQLVRVKAEGYGYLGQVISRPFIEGDVEMIMVRRVPDDPATMEKMKVQELLVANVYDPPKAKWVHYAKVSGKGTFPIDMLRYDFAAPVNFKFVEDRWGDLTKPELTTQEYGEDLIVATASELKSQGWTGDRWRSFMWSCVPMKSVKIEGSTK